MSGSILTPKSCEIIKEQTGRSLQELGTGIFMPVRDCGFLEWIRQKVVRFRLAKKSTGIQRLLRHFR